MARPTNTEERRQQIIEGLLVVMAERGYEGASTQTIAKAAKLSAGLLHYHFHSKLEILLALIDVLAQRVAARYERFAASASSPRARLYACLDAYVARGPDASEQAVACWVAIGAEALRDEQVREAYERVVRDGLKRLDALVSGVLTDEGRSRESVSEVSAGLMSTIHGAYQLATVSRATPRGFAAGAVRRMADGLIAAQPMVTP